MHASVEDLALYIHDGSIFRLSSSDLDSASACSNYQPVIAKDGKKDGKQSMSTGHKAKIRKALMKFNIMPSRNVNR